MEVIETQEPESVDLGNFILDAVDRNKICRLRCAKFSETSRSACRCVTCKSFKLIAACTARGLQFSTISWIVACVTAWMTPLQVIDGRRICAKMHYLQRCFHSPAHMLGYVRLALVARRSSGAREGEAEAAVGRVARRVVLIAEPSVAEGLGSDDHCRAF